MQSAKQTISFRTKAETRDCLDQVAEALGQNRSYILNQAIEAYLEIYNWQTAHIKKGQQQAKNGELVPEEQWRSAFNRSR